MIIKNSNLRRKIVDNRYKMLGVIIAIILVLLLIQMFNYMAKMQVTKQNEQKLNTTTNTGTINETKPSEGIISGGTLGQEQQQNNDKIIKTFFEYCNQQKVQEAYDLLSQDCKKAVYPTVEVFKKNFLDINFKTKKDYKAENWINTYDVYTYKIKMYEDIMTTGKVTDSYSEDYFSIKRGEEKLNINSYIGKETINKEQGTQLKIGILERETYMDYEIYHIKVVNNTGKKVLLDSLEDKTMYIQAQNDVKYSPYRHELGQETLVIPNNYTKEITIKFNKIYKANNRAMRICFNKIILDDDAYQNYAEKNLYNNVTQYIITL